MVAHRVSVVTPCYNSAPYVARTIASVRAQTLDDWEHVVVDDGSTDRSAEVVAELAAEEPRLRLVRQANAGVCAARNAGYRACGQASAYLLFLDADDVLAPDMLATMTAYLDAHPDVGLAHCGHGYIGEDDVVLGNTGNRFGWIARYVPARLGIRALPPDRPETPFCAVFVPAGMMPSASLIRRSVYAQTPGWDEQFGQHYEDTDLFFHVALHSRVHYVAPVLMYHRQHPGQSTADPARVAGQEAKLYAKWCAVEGLGATQRRALRHAQWFRERRYVPYVGWQAACRHLRRGELALAARFAGGAARRYLPSLLPWSRPGTERGGP